VSRAGHYLRKCRHWWQLAATAAPGSHALKLLGRPGYRGGPGTKADQLAPLLAEGAAPYDTLLALSAVPAPLFLLRWLRRKGVRILVNQNGVYYPSWAGASFQKRNEYLRKLNELSQHTFFQSRFAMESYQQWVGPLPASHSVLHNPVETALFHLSPRVDAAPKIILFFYDFRESYRLYWEHLFGWLRSSSFPRLPSGSRVLAIGNRGAGGEALLRELRGRECPLPVEFHADLPREQLPGILTGADMMVHLIYNDVCPNKVLEAMASGVWPVCSSVGGSKELVGEAGAVLELPAGYEKVELPSHEAMSGALARFLKDPENLRAQARKRAENFEISLWREEIRRVGGKDSN
jgi:glycosyltransferase involved in cell wall biosynthesis